MGLSLLEELGGSRAEKEPTFKVKKWGVIPPKRRSVKRMMLDKIVKSVSSVFQACFHPASSTAASTLQPKSCGSPEDEVLKMAPNWKAKKTRIFPRIYQCLATARQNNRSPN